MRFPIEHEIGPLQVKKLDERKEGVVGTYALHLSNNWRELMNWRMAEIIAEDAYEFFVEGKKVLECREE